MDILHNHQYSRSTSQSQVKSDLHQKSQVLSQTFGDRLSFKFHMPATELYLSQRS